jgi:hypothetical protein
MPTQRSAVQQVGVSACLDCVLVLLCLPPDTHRFEDTRLKLVP